MDWKKLVVEELHKPARKNFPRRCTVLKGINDLFQGDLVEIGKYSKVNKNFKYLFTIINCFTKVADAIPLKNKEGISVSKAMDIAIKRNGFKIKHLQTDDGKEFYNKHFEKLMKRYNINHYSTKSDKKASIVERFNRTLKNAMFKMFSLRGSYQWIDIIKGIVYNYNNTYHRTIGMKPVEVNEYNESIVKSRINKSTTPANEKIPPRTFSLGEMVRISKYKNIFTKGYLPNWTNEVFEVYRVQPTNPKTYLLKDSKGEILNGSFYGHEMLKSKTGNVYLVERILKRKGDKVLVRWLGFDKSADTWEHINNIL